MKGIKIDGWILLEVWGGCFFLSTCFRQRGAEPCQKGHLRRSKRRPCHDHLHLGFFLAFFLGVFDPTDTAYFQDHTALRECKLIIWLFRGVCFLSICLRGYLRFFISDCISLFTFTFIDWYCLFIVFITLFGTLEGCFFSLCLLHLNLIVFWMVQLLGIFVKCRVEPSSAKEPAGPMAAPSAPEPPLSPAPGEFA